MIKNFPYQWDEELCLRSTNPIESVGSHWWPYGDHFWWNDRKALRCERWRENEGEETGI